MKTRYVTNARCPVKSAINNMGVGVHDDQIQYVVLTLTRKNQSVVTEQAPVTLELRNTPGKNTNKPKGVLLYTHISQLTQLMPPPETYESEIGSQPTMCQVYIGAYVSLLAPVKTDYLVYRLPPKKDYHVYIARSTYHYAYARQTQVNWKI